MFVIGEAVFLGVVARDAHGEIVAHGYVDGAFTNQVAAFSRPCNSLESSFASCWGFVLLMKFFLL